MDRRDFTDRIKIRFVRRSARWIRRVVFSLINFCGEILFFILRRLKLLPPVLPLEKDKVNKILIVRPDMIGDVVLATPFIRAVRENFPRAHLAMLVSESTKDIVLKNPYLDEVIAVKRIGFGSFIRDSEVIKSVEKKQFDLALVLYYGLACNIFVFLAGIPQRIGYGDKGSGFLLTKSFKRNWFEKHPAHMVDMNLNLLKAIDGKINSRELEISVYEDSENKAREFFLSNNLNEDDVVVMIHPGSSRPYQRWPEDKFTQLADRLIDEKKVKIIFLSGPAEGNLIKDITGRMRNPSVTAAGFPLKDVISLIKRSDVFIGHSTGTTHLADGLGILTVMLIGFSGSFDSAQFWGVLNKENIMVSKDVDCKRCIPGDCKYYPCMTEITVADVFQAAVKQIGKLNKKANRI